jgi:hypothetical protein
MAGAALFNEGTVRQLQRALINLPCFTKLRQLASLSCEIHKDHE